MEHKNDKNTADPYKGGPSEEDYHNNGASGQNHYGDGKADPDSGDANPTGEDHLVWVTPPVLLSETEKSNPCTADGI